MRMHKNSLYADSGIVYVSMLLCDAMSLLLCDVTFLLFGKIYNKTEGDNFAAVKLLWVT